MNCGTCGQPLPLAKEAWDIWIPIEPPSQNVVAQNKGGGRHKYRRIRQEYEMALLWKRNIPKAKGKRRVAITRCYSRHGKERDLANIVGGCKALMDALTLTKLIVDDSPKYLEAHYSQERGKASGVRIVLEDI